MESPKSDQIHQNVTTSYQKQQSNTVALKCNIEETISSQKQPQLSIISSKYNPNETTLSQKQKLSIVPSKCDLEETILSQKKPQLSIVSSKWNSDETTLSQKQTQPSIVPSKWDPEETTSSPSPEMFSFPGTPTEDQSEFEFGSYVTPHSPILNSKDLTKSNTFVDFSSSSPADQFFLNGRLLPHDFPVQTTSSTRTSFSGRENMGPTSVTLSRGTSIGSNKSSQPSSKDYSLVSSRSNSTNSSRTSTCSTCAVSGRNSSSEVLERKTIHRRMHSVKEKTVGNSPLGQYYKYGTSGSSQRWQFITAAPVLGPSNSRRGRKENGVGSATSPRMVGDVGRKGKRTRSNSNGNSNESFLYKILRMVVTTCKACHAMEGQEKEFELEATNEVLGH